MVSDIIDREGKECAQKVKISSKTLQENESLNDEQTNSLMTGTKVPELAFRKMRTVSKKSYVTVQLQVHAKLKNIEKML